MYTFLLRLGYLVTPQYSILSLSLSLICMCINIIHFQPSPYNIYAYYHQIDNENDDNGMSEHIFIYILWSIIIIMCLASIIIFFFILFWRTHQVNNEKCTHCVCPHTNGCSPWKCCVVDVISNVLLVYVYVFGCQQKIKKLATANRRPRIRVLSMNEQSSYCYHISIACKHSMP